MKKYAKMFNHNEILYENIFSLNKLECKFITFLYLSQNQYQAIYGEKFYDKEKRSFTKRLDCMIVIDLNLFLWSRIGVD